MYSATTCCWNFRYFLTLVYGRLRTHHNLYSLPFLIFQQGVGNGVLEDRKNDEEKITNGKNEVNLEVPDTPNYTPKSHFKNNEKG